MDIEAYRIRKKKSVADLAELLGVKQAAVYNYKYGKSKPSYESIEKMLLDGAFLSELFSSELQEKVLETHKFCALTESAPNEFKEGLELSNKPMTKEEVVALFREMKAKGEI